MPISVTDPASVVTCASGSRISRAGILRICSSCRLAGISIATSGVVLISDDATPIGALSLRMTCCEDVAEASSAAVTRETMPVWTTPFAITSIAPTVITPGLPRPANRSTGSEIPRMPAVISATSSARTGSTLPDAIAASVTTSSTAVTQIGGSSAHHRRPGALTPTRPRSGPGPAAAATSAPRRAGPWRRPAAPASRPSRRAATWPGRSPCRPPRSPSSGSRRSTSASSALTSSAVFLPDAMSCWACAACFWISAPCCCSSTPWRCSSSLLLLAPQAASDALDTPTTATTARRLR